MLRIDYDDPGSLTTLVSAARAIDDMAAHRLPVFVEPFLSRRIAGHVRNDLGAEAVTKSLTIASGLGATSAYTWLKVPVTERVEDMERVLAASMLPVVLLGGVTWGGRARRGVRAVAGGVAVADGAGVGGGAGVALSVGRGCGGGAVDTAVGLL
ncbi:hypothetical protein GCM10020000_51970 [Streptomyces olivoverticillatus]